MLQILFWACCAVIIGVGYFSMICPTRLHLKSVGFIILAICAFLACGVSKTERENSSKEKEQTISESVNQKKIINYEVLRSWVPGRSGNGMEILVSPNSTKEEVLALATALVDEYRTRGLFIAMIFDSKEAWANLDNDKYPEEEYYKHKLVHIFVPPLPGDQEIVWTANKRVGPKK